MLLEVCSVGGERFHFRGKRLVGDGDKALRASLLPGGIAIDFDEAVVEVDRRIVLHPVLTELEPVGEFARLVEADEVANDLRLLRIGYLLRVRKRLIGLFQIHRVEAGGHRTVRRARAIDLFLQLPIWHLSPRVSSADTSP